MQSCRKELLVPWENLWQTYIHPWILIFSNPVLKVKVPKTKILFQLFFEGTYFILEV